MASTLAQLVVPQSVTYFFNLLLGTYQANGFQVQSWQPGGVERTRLMAMATALADKATNYAPNIAAGILLDYSTSDGKGGGWLPLTASEFYALTQNLATFTQGSIALTAAAGVSTQTLQAGQLKATFAATGNSYLNTGTVVIPVGPGSVIATFQAEFAGASYSDPSSSGALTLSTPIPGVTLTNPAGNYSAVAHVGSGTGTLTLGGSPVGAHLFIVRIDSTGASGGATWSYSLDGAPFVSAGNASPSLNVGGTGVSITLVNGGSGTSFAFNDTYTFNTPGSWISTQGGNIETDAALQTRCRNRWSSLSAIPTQNLYALLATSTPTVGSQVTQVIVVPDSVINSRVNIIVAGPGGALPGPAVALIQTFISARVPTTVLPVAGSPSTSTITLAGTITALASQLTAAQTAIQTAMTAYIGSVGINGTVRLAAVIELIMQIAGVVDATGITINGGTSNVVLGTSSTFVVPSLATLGFGYVTQ